MTPRARKLIAIGLVIVGYFVAATYRPFGGSQPGDLVRVADPEESGHSTGFRCGQQLAMEDVERFKTPERIAQYLASKDGLARGQRDVWCAAFVKGFNAGMKQRLATAAK